jgi:hypothetical protein
MKQKETEKVKVVCYSGHRLHVKPLSFVYRNKKYKIEKVLSQTIEESMVEKIRLYRYSVLCQKREVFTLIYDHKLDQWFLEVVPSNHSNAVR